MSLLVNNIIKSGTNKQKRKELTKENYRSLQSHNILHVDIESESEFNISVGVQEYKVHKVNDMYFITPCSPEDVDIPTEYKNSFHNFNNCENKRAKPNKSLNSTSAKTQTKLQSSPKTGTWNNKINNAKDTKSTTIWKEGGFPQIRPQSPSKIGSWNNKMSITKNIKARTPCKEINSIQPSITKKSREFLNLVNQAIKFQKIFTIGNHNRRAFPTIREALKTRGWVEKCAAESFAEEEMIPSKTSEITMRLLKESSVNFIWVMNFVDFGNIKDDAIVSRFPKHNHFTTKVGLCSFLEDFQWFYEPNISKTISPKTFNIATADDVDNFIKEFGLTACISLLKIVVTEVTTAESDHFFRNGKVPVNVVDFANAQCSEYILHRRHEDIDRQEDTHTTVKEWNEFLSWFYMIAHEKEHFETTPYPMIQALYTMSKMSLKNLEIYWPQMNIEGCKNIWIIKPAAQFCGRGVKVLTNLEDIINNVDVKTDSKISRHIVQKYIESPLLIYNTKFDIRQWFLITSVYPLVIWIYKECYLRFSSQPFSLVDFHESIHLTNNAIQKNYTNNSGRNPKLPEENMWHCSTFLDYLKEIGETHKWENVIMPGMKQGIVGAVLASQEEMVDRQNSFELYGADFLLGSDFTPLLLEINMGPSMAPSTNVTAQLCKEGLEDVIKVVLDRRHNTLADTGKFEILYKQDMGPRQHHLGLDLMVSGSKLIPERRIKKL